MTPRRLVVPALAAAAIYLLDRWITAEAESDASRENYWRGS